MNIVAVLGYMGIEASLSWSNDSPYPQEYSKDVDIQKIPVKYNEGYTAPSNEDFHRSAEALIELNAARDLEAQKEAEHPSQHQWLKAITSQLALLSDRFEIPQHEDFIKVRQQIERVENKYQK